MPESRPVVLSISGHDPSGGAGIQADIETIAALSCHPCTVVTALTLQDTHNARKILPQPGGQIREQLRLLFDDLNIRCVKIGLSGAPDIVSGVSDFLREWPRIPVVLDPVLAAGGGYDFSDASLAEAISKELVPLSTVMTPNLLEARRLSTPRSEIDACGWYLNSLGCGYVLITGADQNTPRVVNRLYCRANPVRSFAWERLPGTYHGSGCTLASAIAALLARGYEPESAISEAQQFTIAALKAGFSPGKGQNVPNRLVGLGSP